MADGIEVEQMVESRPKKVNIFKAQLYPASFSRIFSACGPRDAHFQRFRSRNRETFLWCGRKYFEYH